MRFRPISSLRLCGLVPRHRDNRVFIKQSVVMTALTGHSQRTVVDTRVSSCVHFSLGMPT